ncbi:MAG TPA: hypothetical protein VF921_08745 [Vicinamibacterales bacterium]
MTRTKTQASAVLVAASMLASTIGIGAADRAPLQESINQAAKALAAQVTPASQSSIAAKAMTTRRDGGAQDPVPSVRMRPASCGCGIPSWVKYTLIGAAAAAGGYAVSQIGHHGGHGGPRGPMDTDGTHR